MYRESREAAKFRREIDATLGRNYDIISVWGGVI